MTAALALGGAGATARRRRSPHRLAFPAAVPTGVSPELARRPSGVSLADAAAGPE